MITRAMTWTDAVGVAYQAVCNHFRLYDGDHGAVFLASGQRLPFELVIPNLLGECLTEPLADLMFPDLPTVTAGSEGQQADIMALLELMGWGDALYPTAICASYAGSACWKLVWNEVEARPDLVVWGRNPGEFATFDPDGRGVNFWYEVVVEAGKAVRRYKVRERHELVDGGTEVTNKAFRMNGNQVQNTPAAWVDVAPAWGGVEPPEEAQFLAGLTLLPGYRIANVLGVSDYTRSRKNLQWRMILLESARNFSVALTTVPQMFIPPDAVNKQTGQLDWEKLLYQYKRPGDGSTAVIDLKTAVTSLGDSSTVLENLWDDWNAVCPISPIFYGKAVASDASGKALGISLLGTKNAVNRRRQAYVGATRWAIQFGSQLNQVYAGQGVNGTLGGETLDFPPAIPEDPADRTTRLTAATRGGWMSIETAVREEHPEWTDEQVQDELDRIDQEEQKKVENAMASFGNPSNPPAGV